MTIKIVLRIHQEEEGIRSCQLIHCILANVLRNWTKVWNSSVGTLELLVRRIMLRQNVKKLCFVVGPFLDGI